MPYIFYICNIVLSSKSLCKCCLVDYKLNHPVIIAEYLYLVMSLSLVAFERHLFTSYIYSDEMFCQDLNALRPTFICSATYLHCKSMDGWKHVGFCLASPA